MDYKEELRGIIENLKQERDELNVKMHLAKSDMKDEMQKLEEKWEDLRKRGTRAMEAVDDSAIEVSDTLRKLGEEIKEGYRKLRESMSKLKP
jgi:uncharacterized coiled-coil DUF342 family protein